MLNPDSSNYVEEVVSPEPRINVADVRDAHPETKTAGIAEAIDELPEGGGTLWFPADRGPYVLTGGRQVIKNYYNAKGVVVTTKNHVHWRSDGAVIQYQSPDYTYIFSTTSGQNPKQRCLAQPATDYYFKGLTFDGMGKARSGFYV